MPSQLYNNSAITFVALRTFVYAGKTYHIGDDFPQEAAGKGLEVLVRTRRVAPVVESRADKPRHWHREVQEREVVLGKLKTDPKYKDHQKRVEAGKKAAATRAENEKKAAAAKKAAAESKPEAPAAKKTTESKPKDE